MDLSVVIPVLNEQDSVGPLIEQIQACLPEGLACEIICIDDGSTDGTPAELFRLADRYPAVRVRRHARHAGQSAAILTGALAAQAPWIATLDGDGQNDPSDIVRLWRRRRVPGAPDGPSLIVGWRRQRRDRWGKRLASRIANAVRSRVLRDHTPDAGCGLKLFCRATFLSLPRFDHMHRFLPGLFQHAGSEVVSVAVNHRPRLLGKSKYGVYDRLWVGIVDLFGVWWLQRRTVPSGVAAADEEGAD
jgi:dolichol-phosphate mannosyltransferase